MLLPAPESQAGHPVLRVRSSCNSWGSLVTVSGGHRILQMGTPNMGCLAFSQHPTSCSLTSPAYLGDHTFPAHGAWTFPNRPYRPGPLVPTQPGPSPAQRAGTHLTSMVLFKDTAVCNPGKGEAKGGVFGPQPSSSKHKHARMPTMPG